MKTGVELIAEERKRQVEEEGWTAEHDAAHTEGDLAMAAATYLLPEIVVIGEDESYTEAVMVSFKRLRLWPWITLYIQP